MPIVNVNLPASPYNIHIEDGLLSQIGRHIRKVYTGKRVSVITDENVAELYLENITENLRHAGMEVVSFVVAPGEPSKSFSVYEKLTEDLARSGHQRTDLIIALGGGVVGDLAGFTASSYMRGVPFVQVPTSLLAQIDSSVGGKTGINIRAGKNLVGAVYQPKAVLIDPLTLDTLPIKYLRDGIGEALKYGFIDRPDLLDIFEGVLNDVNANSELTPFRLVLMRRGEIIQICCESKRDFVLQDERDFGKRMILNYGHTIGHAIEKLHGYKTYTHGEAVAMGMYFMQQISETSGKSVKGICQRLKDLLVGFELYNTDMKTGNEKWMDAIAKDKKNLNNKLNVIFVERPGVPVVYGTTQEDFQKLLKEGLK